jgi:hypothetical protein
MELNKYFKEEDHKHLDLLLLLTEEDKRASPFPVKWLPRAFYKTRECYSGYSYLKPISKMLYEVK